MEVKETLIDFVDQAWNDPIDFDPIEKPLILSCGHYFDARSIEKWITQKRSCPTCRGPVKQAPFVALPLVEALGWKAFAEQLVENAQAVSANELGAASLGRDLFLFIAGPSSQRASSLDFAKLVENLAAVKLEKSLKEFLIVLRDRSGNRRNFLENAVNFLSFSLKCPPCPPSLASEDKCSEVVVRVQASISREAVLATLRGLSE